MQLENVLKEIEKLRKENAVLKEENAFLREQLESTTKWYLDINNTCQKPKSILKVPLKELNNTYKKYFVLEGYHKVSSQLINQLNYRYTFLYEIKKENWKKIYSLRNIGTKCIILLYLLCEHYHIRLQGYDWFRKNVLLKNTRILEKFQKNIRFFN